VYSELVATGLRGVTADAALERTLEVADRCDVVLPKLKDLVYPGTEDELVW
jgi:hypothetical protein